ncbi:hypothetical protein QA641_14590 [Bradyrhizobium sp. CB1650]|uniref:hypothetical protein n=1 Tax=Bradyrhizobium sp. CB1650 TaxID=3039153 RepID=UPI0024354D23|nr:hypothetical protein [Bradyrhizobium sp. CB1650]WGD55022.1 hypothetical protein QA641_14590 [Bradyrhizobium sp. CB1650]
METRPNKPTIPWGRFDRQVLGDRPDKTGRVAILKVHIRKIRMGEDVDPYDRIHRG